MKSFIFESHTEQSYSPCINNNKSIEIICYYRLQFFLNKTCPFSINERVALTFVLSPPQSKNLFVVSQKKKEKKKKKRKNCNKDRLSTKKSIVDQSMMADVYDMPTSNRGYCGKLKRSRNTDRRRVPPFFFSISSSFFVSSLNPACWLTDTDPTRDREMKRARDRYAAGNRVNVTAWRRDPDRPIPTSKLSRASRGETKAWRFIGWRYGHTCSYDAALHVLRTWSVQNRPNFQCSYDRCVISVHVLRNIGATPWSFADNDNHGHCLRSVINLCALLPV